MTKYTAADLEPNKPKSLTDQTPLFQLLKTQAGLLCESHNARVRDELLQRVFSTLMKLLPRKQAKKAKRESLVELLQSSAYEGTPTVIAKGDSVFINGNFDINQLCAQIVWKDTIANVDLTDMGE